MTRADGADGWTEVGKSNREPMGADGGGGDGSRQGPMGVDGGLWEQTGDDGSKWELTGAG